MPDQIESLLVLTRSMLDAADAQKWDILAELETRRVGIISEIFAAPPSQRDAGRLAACLQQVLTLDRRIIDQGEAGLRELAGKLAEFDHGRRVQGAYQDAASD